MILWPGRMLPCIWGEGRERAGQRGRGVLQYLIIIQMQIQTQGQLVESVAVVDIDAGLALFRPSQQKWVSSLELSAEMPNPKSNSKIITLAPALHLTVNFCEKNRAPLCDLDFLPHPSPDWLTVKMPSSFQEKYAGLALSYRTQDNSPSEPLTDIEILITERKRMGEDKQVFILPPGYKIINNNPIAHSYLIYKRIKSVLEQTFKPILLEKYPQENRKINQSLLPMFCFPEGIHLSKELKGFISFNFVLTLETGERIYANCLSFKECLEENLKNKLNLNTPDKIYYEKAICLLSKHRYTDEFSECLKHLYRLSMSKNDVPFHKVVMSYVNSMVLPKQIGINGLSYSYGGSNINFDTNASYPIISERSIYCVFKFLPLQCIISIFEAILLEKKIIFVSQSKTILGFAIEAFLSFVFPFRWEHVLIPILPSTLKQYMAAPVPLIVGINPSMVDNTIESDSIVVQMDNGTVLNDEDLPPLPDKLEKQLRKRLECFELYDEDDVKEYLQNPESTYIFKMQEVEHPQFQGHIIRDCFFEFMLTLMKNYKKFWKVQKYKELKENSSLSLTEPQLLNDIFKVQDFLSDLGMSKVGSFGYKFTEGTIFTSFIERRHQIIEDAEMMFFDECLDKKKAKKDMKLLEKISNIRYIVAKHPEPESVKGVFVYEKFPSILGKQPIKQLDIELKVEEFDEEQLEYLQEFLDEQYKTNSKLFNQSEASDIDFKIMSLLLIKFKQRYSKQLQGLSGNGQTKNELFHSSMGSSKIKNSRLNYDKLKIFQRLYSKQLEEIEELFMSCPYESEELLNIKQVGKREYICKYMKMEAFEEEELYCVYEEYYGYKYRNYEMMVKNNVKILFLEREDKQSPKVIENLRNSKRKLKYHYEVHIQHFKIKNFINKVIPVQAHSLFDFIIAKIQKENVNLWTLDTLIEWRDHLLKHPRKHS